MSTTAQELLAAFDALPAADRDAVVLEILSRQPIGAGQLPDESLIELADEVFRSYDAEEATDAAPPR
jgi:hypothetical protein